MRPTRSQEGSEADERRDARDGAGAGDWTGLVGSPPLAVGWRATCFGGAERASRRWRAHAVWTGPVECWRLESAGEYLLAYADESYQESGYGGSLVYEPGADGRGLRMRLGYSSGAAASRVRSLWALENAAGLVRHRAACPSSALRHRGRLRARRRPSLVSLPRRRRHRPETFRPQAQLRPVARHRLGVRPNGQRSAASEGGPSAARGHPLPLAVVVTVRALSHPIPRRPDVAPSDSKARLLPTLLDALNRLLGAPEHEGAEGSNSAPVFSGNLQTPGRRGALRRADPRLPGSVSPSVRIGPVRRTVAAARLRTRLRRGATTALRPRIRSLPLRLDDSRPARSGPTSRSSSTRLTGSVASAAGALATPLAEASERLLSLLDIDIHCKNLGHFLRVDVLPNGSSPLRACRRWSSSSARG